MDNYLNKLYELSPVDICHEKINSDTFQATWIKSIDTWQTTTCGGIPNIRGLTLDPMCAFKAHSNNTNEKLKTRNNALKSLGDSDRRMVRRQYNGI